MTSLLTQDITTLRGLFFIEGIAATFIYCWIFGRAALGRGISYWVTGLGFAGILIYVTSAQVKAYRYQAPFDGYSWTGLISINVLIIGFCLYLALRRDTSRR